MEERLSSNVEVSISDEVEDSRGPIESSFVLGGQSYLDESITPHMTPMKVEEVHQ